MFGRKSKSEEYKGQIVDQESVPTKPGDPTLIVDLPDGQKLIVGAIEPGTVIEVATWRGTGRPDSRTTRMLLGAGINEDARKKAIAAPKSDKNYSGFTGEPDPREPANQLTASKQEIVKGKHGVAKKVSHFQKFGYIAAGIVVVLSIPMVIANNGLFGITSPEIGLATKLGSASSSVAITTSIDKPKNGDVVIATIDINNQTQKLLARVLASGENKVLLQGNGLQYEVPITTVTSKVRAVIPFVGPIARILGV